MLNRIPVPVFSWRTSKMFPESLGVVAGVVKSAGEGDLRDGFLSSLQQAAAHFQPVGDQKVNGGLLEIALEDGTAFIAADMAGCRNVSQGYFFIKMLVNIGYHVSLDYQVRRAQRFQMAGRQHRADFQQTAP